MVISDKLKKELLTLDTEINYILENNIVTDYRLENFFKKLEKTRYNILSEIKVYNKNVNLECEKINTIDADYKASISDNILKIYVPETIPSYKNKRILQNIAEITKQYSGLFENKVFIYIKIFDNITGWDVDNRFIKPISDALIMSGVIKDDNIDKMFYCVNGEFSDNPHTEIYVYDSNTVKLF